MLAPRLLALALIVMAAGCGLTSGGGDPLGTGGATGGDDGQATGGASDLPASGGAPGLDVDRPAPDEPFAECKKCTSEGPACIAPDFHRVCLTLDELRQCRPPGEGFGISLCGENETGEGGAAGATGSSANDQACPRVEELTFTYVGTHCGTVVTPVCPSGPALHEDENGETTDECCYPVYLFGLTC